MFTRCFLMLMVISSSTGLFGQNVHFNFTDGTTQSFALQDVRNITFSAAVMNLNLNGGTTLSWNVSTIGHYTYDDLLVSVENTTENLGQTALTVYPNPSSGHLTLEYVLEAETSVIIDILDLQGRIVKQLLRTTQAIGPQKVQWDGLNQAGNVVASGTYLCRLNTPKVQMSRTIIIQQ
jgi:hypothetical protein